MALVSAPLQPHAGPRHRAAAGPALILLAVAAFSAIPFLPDRLNLLSMALAVALVLAIAWRDPQAIQVTLVATTLALLMQVPALRVASLPMVLTLLVYAAVVLPVAPLRRSVTWLQRGLLDRAALWQIAGITALSSAALLAWFTLTQPDVGALKAMLGGLSPLALVALGIVLPLLNATVEELIFRGVMMGALGSVIGSALVVNLVQALSFGLLHKDGFPSGAWGVALAALYAFLLGLLRQRTRGLLAPWIAHVVADATIFAIIVKLA